MKLRILVVDDEATDSKEDKGDRWPYYAALNTADAPADIARATSAKDAESKLGAGVYDVVMLDVTLKHFGDDDLGTVFRKLFVEASKRCVVALVSGRWDGTVVPRVSRVLAEDLEVPVPLMLSFEDFRSNAYAAIVMQIHAHVRRVRGGLHLELGANDPFRILHLSDLHFGSSHAKKTIVGEANRDKLRQAILKNVEGVPHVIAFTGDISNTGHPAEYEEAARWIEGLLKDLGVPVPSRRILLVPGNHDFSIPVSLSAALRPQWDEGSKKLTFPVGAPDDHSVQLSRYATRGFLDLSEQLSGVNRYPGASEAGSWVETGFREHGVIFTGLNTSARPKADGWPARLIDEEDASAAAQAVRALAGERLFHVVLSHHPLIPAGGREPIENPEVFEQHFLEEAEAYPHLLLNGHEHGRRGDMPRKDSLLMVCAPTPSVGESGRGTDTLRGFNVISLERKNWMVRAAKASAVCFHSPRWTKQALAPYDSVRRT